MICLFLKTQIQEENKNIWSRTLQVTKKGASLNKQGIWYNHGLKVTNCFITKRDANDRQMEKIQSKSNEYQFAVEGNALHIKNMRL